MSFMPPGHYCKLSSLFKIAKLYVGFKDQAHFVQQLIKLHLIIRESNGPYNCTDDTATLYSASHTKYMFLHQSDWLPDCLCLTYCQANRVGREMLQLQMHTSTDIGDQKNHH